MKKCIFAGTFDPFTVGHADTVKKSLTLFDEVIVAVAENRRKVTMFTAEERKEMIEEVFRGEPRVRVLIWDGVIVDLLKREDTPFYVRGVRNAVDCAYETDDFYASKDLYPALVTLFLPAEQGHTHISSTLVKNALAFGTPFENYVPKTVYDYILRKKSHVPETN